MNSALSTIRLPDGRTNLHLNFGVLQRPFQNSIKRTAVFLAYAHNTEKLAPLAHINIDTAIHYDIGLPDQIPPQDRKKYKNEFISWTLGQILTELDQTYHRFADRASDVLKRTKKFSRTGELDEESPVSFKNTWAVHDGFYACSGSVTSDHIYESLCLRSLGNARNCLIHDSGIVTGMRIVEDGKLPVRWIGTEMLLTDPNGRTKVLPAGMVHRATKADIGSQLSTEIIKRERFFVIGDQLSLTRPDLNEIVWFYYKLALRLNIELKARYEKISQDSRAI